MSSDFVATLYSQIINQIKSTKEVFSKTVMGSLPAQYPSWKKELLKEVIQQK